MPQHPVSETNGVAPAPPPEPHPLHDEPMVSIQSQISLLVVAVLTILSFIFHSDFSSLVPAVTTLALAIFGAAIAIARAIKHRTIAEAQARLNSQRLDVWAQQQQAAEFYTRHHARLDFNAVAADIDGIDNRVKALEQKAPKKAVSRPTKTATRARRASGPRKSAASR